MKETEPQNLVRLSELPPGTWIVDPGSGLPARISRKGYVNSYGQFGMMVDDIQHLSMLHNAQREIPGTTLVAPFDPSKLDSRISALAVPLKIGMSGTDPEIFAFRADGSVIPAFEILPSEAEMKAKMKQTASSTPLPFWDGFQAEVTPPANSCHEILVGNLMAQLKALRSKLPPGGYLDPKDVVEVPAELLSSLPPERVEFGCSPSRNAYGSERYPRINIADPYGHRERYSGCHLHYSWTSSMVQIDDRLPLPSAPPSWFPEGVVVMMDKISGIILTALGRDLEDPRRRIAYGRPGEYRVPGPGRLEYRTPGSFLFHHPVLFYLGLDTSRLAFNLGLRQSGFEFDLPPADEIIQHCDASSACSYIRSNFSFFQSFFRRCYPGTKLADAALELVLQGAASAGFTKGSHELRWSKNLTVKLHFEAA